MFTTQDYVWEYWGQVSITNHKTHAMTTHDTGAGHTGKGRDPDLQIEDTRDRDIGPSNDNKSTNSLDTMIAFGRSKADASTSNLLPNSHANLSILTIEINSFWQ